MFSKTTMASIIAIITLIGGWIAIDNFFVTASDLKALEKNTANTLESFQMRIDTSFDLFLLDKLNQEIFTYKRLIRERPNDDSLKDELNDLIKQKDKIKERVNERLRGNTK